MLTQVLYQYVFVIVRNIVVEQSILITIMSLCVNISLQVGGNQNNSFASLLNQVVGCLVATPIIIDNHLCVFTTFFYPVKKYHRNAPIGKRFVMIQTFCIKSE